MLPLEGTESSEKLRWHRLEEKAAERLSERDEDGETREGLPLTQLVKSKNELRTRFLLSGRRKVAQ
jgi:hypothetical protein